MESNPSRGVRARPKLPSRVARGGTLHGRAALLGGATFLCIALLGCAGGAHQLPPEVPVPTEPRTALELRGAVAGDPRNPRLNYALAVRLAEDGEVEESLTYFTEAERLDPTLRPKIVEERQRLSDYHLDQAEIRLEEAFYQEASAALDRAEVMTPFRPRTAHLHGRMLAAQGKSQEALPYLRRAARADPESEPYRDALVDGCLAVARVHYEREQHARAWELLEEANTLRPDSENAYLRGLVAYAWARDAADPERVERLDLARASFEQVLEENPDDEDALFNLGAVYLTWEQYDEAVRIYKRLIAVHPTDGGLYLALARAHSLSGQTEYAVVEDAIGRALRAGDPVNDPTLWGTRAAERYPETDLDTLFVELGPPDAVYTYNVPGGSLVEVWFYWNMGSAHAFREGGRLGLPFLIPRRD